MSGADHVGRAALRSEAAHWFNLHLAGDMTLDDESRFHEWLGRSDLHRELYRGVERAWSIAGAAADDPALRVPRKDLSVAAGVARRGWRALALAASIILLVAAGLALAPYFRAEPAQLAQSFRTELGQRSTITLPDGTVVTLDSETDLRFRQAPHERLAELIGGRAFFRVAHDKSRPFFVHAGGKSVRAVGTAFEVSIEGGDVVVVLAEGKVRVEETTSGSGNSTDMVPGRQLTIGADRNWTLRRVDVSKETSWTEGRLVFMNDALAEAVAEVNRYSSRKLTFAGGRVPDRKIVGVFKAGDVEGFVKAIELNGIAHRVSASGDAIILSEGPASS
ncbi:FecR family protein [Sphingopyxis indica]|uniref:FecR family protein n=1 Tax=Sphingopyxis indica TaxID=436663 RepID=A0A239FS72_9SPHN|nr:FecR domain-containing protein [Sphingopyxis indica]SNS59896.1 FecR family protein [Sphingopyxis indica]